MKRKFILPLLTLATAATLQAKEPLHNVSLSDVTPEGWLREMLENQRDNFSDVIDEHIFPFNKGGWGTDAPFLRKYQGEVAGFWVPYEQAGYYYDGIIRLGILLDDQKMMQKARTAIYGSIDRASEEGIIQSDLWQGDRRRWPHAVFFRAWMAEYEATGNKKVIEALERHFINDTVALVGRDAVNVETLYWLYDKTENKKLRDMIDDVRYSRVKGAHKEDSIGDFGSSEKQEIHGVTYNEMLKMPIIYYMLTGDKKELDAARNGFAKLDKYHMLPDGINSSEEGVSGNRASNAHEACNIVDYLWTCNYMLRATHESQWGDRMERALFNAGMGSITKEFDAHQYYSCPNQVVCNEHSSHIMSYTRSRMAYRQMHKPPCCTGNINRMLPIYVGSQWLAGDKGDLFKALYGPGSIEHKTASGEVTLTENSIYPYTDTIEIEVSEGEAKFALNLRVPGWCTNPEIKYNGAALKGVKSGEYYTLNRTFKKGDKIELNFPKKAEFINWDSYESMVVNYGPLLFSLPVDAHVSKIWTSELAYQPEPFMAYEMSPASDWNYILGVDGTDNSLIRVVKSDKIDPKNPWSQYPQPIKLQVPMYKDPTWELMYRKINAEGGQEIFSPVTPPLPARGAMIFVLRRLSPELKSLVPYGSTCLRMTMFPFWKESEISPEVLAAE